MTQTVLYKYLGTNGVIESPIHLEDIYYVRSIYLQADSGKILTNGKTPKYAVKVAEDEVGSWFEIIDPHANKE